MDQIRRVYLIGAEHSLFTGKLRSYLRYKQIQHELIPSSRKVMEEFILPAVGWSVVPVVVVDFVDGAQRVIQDTAVVIDFFESLQGHPVPSIHPPSPKQRLVSEILALLADEFLSLMLGMYFRWSFPKENDTFLCNEWHKLLFPQAHLHGSAEKRRQTLQLSEKSRSSFSTLLPVLGITEDTVAQVKELAEGVLQALEQHLAAHEFLLGGRPCLADIAFMGFLYAHLYRDPASGLLVRSRYPRVAEYVEKLSLHAFPIRETQVSVDAAGKYRFAPVAAAEEGFVEDDRIPETLMPLLEVFFKNQLPLLESTLELLRDFKQSASDLSAELPRMLGMNPLEINGRHSHCVARTFEMWKLQNMLDVLRGLPQQEVTKLLDRFGDRGKAFAKLDMSDVAVYKDIQGPCSESTLYFTAASKL